MFLIFFLGIILNKIALLFTDDDDNIILNNLNFADVEGNVYFNRNIIKNHLINNNHVVGGNHHTLNNIALKFDNYAVFNDEASDTTIKDDDEYE